MLFFKREDGYLFGFNDDIIKHDYVDHYPISGDVNIPAMELTDAAMIRDGVYRRRSVPDVPQEKAECTPNSGQYVALSLPHEADLSNPSAPQQTTPPNSRSPSPQPLLRKQPGASHNQNIQHSMRKTSINSGVRSHVSVRRGSTTAK